MYQMLYLKRWFDPLIYFLFLFSFFQGVKVLFAKNPAETFKLRWITIVSVVVIFLYVFIMSFY